MKISEMTNDQAADTLVRISEPFASLCNDEQISELLEKYKDMEETQVISIIGKFLPEIVACAFKKHRDDVMEIVGALTMQSKEKAAKMKVGDTLKVIREAVNDEDLRGFFTSLKGQTKGTELPSAQD